MLFQELPPGYRWKFVTYGLCPTIELHKKWLFFWLMRDYEPVSILVARTYGVDAAIQKASLRILERNPFLGVR